MPPHDTVQVARFGPPRRLLLHIHGLSGGGAERVWSVLASALAARGHQVTLAVDDASSCDLAMLDPAIRVELLGKNHLISIVRLARLIRRLKPEASLSAVSAANLKLVLAKLVGLSRLPTIISYHGFIEHRTGLLGWAGVAGLRALSRVADRTIGVSDALATELVTRWGAIAGRTIRIHNPVGVGGAPPPIDLAELARRDPIILAVGRLIADKAVDVIVRAFAALEQPRARLIVLGDGPERPRLEALAIELGIADRVTFAGYQASPWQYYATAKCLAHASRSEAFGNIIVEAMAYGLEVVATASEGPREILQDGRYGRVVPIDDVGAMVAAIGQAIDAPSDPAPRQAYAATFAPDPGAAVYEALVETVLAERRR